VRVRLVLWHAVAEVVTTWPEVGLLPDRLHGLRPLVGYGPDTAAVVYTAAYPPELAHIEDPSAIWDRAHNETLDLLAPGDAGLVGTGRHSRAGGGLHTAIVFYHQAFRLAPSRAELRTDLGHVYHNHGRYAEALAQYRAALEIDPQFAAAHYDSGLAWLALRRQDLAREAFQAALGLDPGCAACQDALQALQE